ncbi:nucleobase:cation symporter-2 family protein [Sphaerochaeta sp. PS]|uniref:uracil-xanthine permease family protein n=1 Tax=Sphaerochaeta sp. PS TaxID=3076336 RepID=UPI0028A40AF8|nr:nucleobase:cation symporter-2 family protein [Sphaerochaeta sp. PS]MDT4763278.1 nucleobase:cation symporter-2 family protein [Sphaerochaeta sp. PS]
MKPVQRTTIFTLEGVPSFRRALPLATQHVVAMIVGCVTPALILSRVASLSAQDSIILVQGALVIAALATFLQLFPINRYLGSGLPVILGVSFAYLPSMQGIARGYDLATIFGAQLVGGLVAIFVGIFVRQLRRFFPPLITGTVVFTIGLSLYPTAINYMAGGVGSPTFGSAQNWILALITLTVVTVLNHFGKGIFKLASILIGIIVGYMLSLFLGIVDFSAISSAGVFQAPQLMHFGIRFEISACFALGILFAINSIQAIGDFTATTVGSMDREPTDTELKAGIIGYGFTNLLGALMGGLPTATYSQNVGIVTTTKVINRITLGLAALILLVAGLVPKFSAILTTIPQCVLGGATISVFASIAMTGMKLVVSEEMNYRNTSIVGLSAALGIGIADSSAAISTFPQWFQVIFGQSPVVIATIVAVALNIMLPKQRNM